MSSHKSGVSLKLDCTTSLEQLKVELSEAEHQKESAQERYGTLRQEYTETNNGFMAYCDNPISEYDQAIEEQKEVNHNLKKQIEQCKSELKSLSDSMKSIQVCGKDCHLYSRDLIIDYNCISKNELSKEVKRFERMKLDLKSNLDRLQYRLDCESKGYYNLSDQLQKLQLELYYLKNLGEKSSARDSYT